MALQLEDNRPHLLIVGGGIAGLSLAYALSCYPLRVTLVEAGQIGQQGASSVPAALLNPHRGRSGRAHPADLAGLKAMWQLVAELKAQGFSPEVHASGVLRLADSAKQAKQWRRLGVRWLEPAEVPGVYHAPYGAMLIATGGHLYPLPLLAALRQACAARGVRIVERCRATALSLPRVITTQGELTADAVILCSGAEKPLVELPGVSPLPGSVVRLAADLRLPYPLAGAVYAVPAGEGVMVGGQGGAARLQAAISDLVPALAAAAPAAQWHGVRLRQAGNRPLVCQLAPGLWFFGALAGRGFLCAYAEAQRLAAQLASGVGGSRLR